MTLREFRTAVFDAFGPRMENATPANVREFLDLMMERRHEEALPPGPTSPLVLDEHAKSYEQIIQEFFSSVLRLPDDEAIINLWILSVEMAFSAQESQYAERFRGLFRDLDGE
jgi:hypothetical protein